MKSKMMSIEPRNEPQMLRWFRTHFAHISDSMNPANAETYWRGFPPVNSEIEHHNPELITEADPAIRWTQTKTEHQTTKQGDTNKPKHPQTSRKKRFARIACRKPVPIRDKQDINE